MAEISAKQAKQLQDNVNAKREGTLFPGMDLKKEVKVEANQYSDILTLLRIRFGEKKAIFIRGNVSSSKNSKEIMQMFTGKSECCNAEYDRKTKICSKCQKVTKSGKRPVLHNSKVVQEYIETNSQQYIDNRPLFLELSKDHQKPLFVGFYVIRDSARRYDYINCMQLICDLMVKHGWIGDDSTDFIIPLFLGNHKDQAKAGVIIKILDTNKYLEKIISLL